MDDFAEIRELVADYFRILHEGDIAGIKEVFLPECSLITPADDGGVTHMTLTEYIQIVEGRESPKENGYPLFGKLISFDQSGPRNAMVKIDCAVQPRYFTDYLSLVKLGDDWKIAAKVYALNDENFDSD